MPHNLEYVLRKLCVNNIKGFILDDEGLKNGRYIGKDYFYELLERIRGIRAFYQKITDIYAQCSIDYDKNSPITRKFYATVQNKLHWASRANSRCFCAKQMSGGVLVAKLIVNDIKI